MARQEFTIKDRMPNLNDYVNALKKHRNAGDDMRDEWHDVVVQECRVAGLGRFTEPVFIEFNWYEPNYKRDIDNVAFAKKFILDGLQKAGVLQNDNYRWVKGFSDKFHYRKGSGVHVIMTEVEDGPNRIVTTVDGDDE